VFTLGFFVRHDQYNYYPSNDPFADYGPLQDESVSQLRFLTNAGARADWSYVKGIHNIKIGATFEHTFLTENDGFGIVNPSILSGTVCPDPTNPLCVLAPYDLTQGGQIYNYHGHTDVKETALYVQDAITKGAWTFNIGIRGDFYNGLQASAKQAEPRGGIAYNVKKTNTVLRVSYARTLESPFNENLILSGTGCSNPVVNEIMTIGEGFACTTSPLTPGFRNEFHAGLQQAFSKHFVLSGEYIWKYTHNAYDFNVFGASPITFPIEWHNSKIPGFAIRGSVPEFHGLTAFIVLSHVAARFFGPTVSGIAPPPAPGVFRIDHDENFAQTTHLQYQPFKRGPWLGFNWRYDSGLVAGATPCYGTDQVGAQNDCPQTFIPGTSTPATVNGLPNGQPAVVLATPSGAQLTADQEFEAGFTCNGAAATPTKPIGTLLNGPNGPYYVCAASGFSSTLITAPAPGTENDDHKPPRIAPRSLFDLAVGQDDLFHNSDRYKWSLRLTVINLANTEALYNFLSTFSGTHYVTPRTVTGEVGFHF
jgi:TonB dependent receptor